MTTDDLNIPQDTLDELYRFVILRYQQESERPINLNSKVSVYFAATALIFGGLAPIYVRFPIGASILHITIYLLLFIAMILLCIILWHFKDFFHGYNYAYPPEIEKIESYIKILIEYFCKYSENYSKIGSANLVISKAYKIYMIGTLSDCINSDFKANNAKSAALVIIGRAISYLFIIVLASLLIFFLIK
ncbi:membrane hypothetical protein [Candidatus Zixiibacteriota bacterium]|nr:membrane hypothetical protein [candidate division Zixibacteria bacterium]